MGSEEVVTNVIKDQDLATTASTPFHPEEHRRKKRATMETPWLTGAGAVEAHVCLGTREWRENGDCHYKLYYCLYHLFDKTPSGPLEANSVTCRPKNSHHTCMLGARSLPRVLHCLHCRG